jgi:hypothetical protein
MGAADLKARVAKFLLPVASVPDIPAFLGCR